MPQVPPAEFIEEAREELGKVDPAMLADQRKELHVAHAGPDTEDFRRGYETGLQVARVMLAHDIKAIQAGVDHII